MSEATDGFRLAYDRSGSGPPALLLHGWPGDRRDYREVAARLTDLDVVVPDLRGFGESDKHPADPADAYSATAQARSVVALLAELDLQNVVIAGYDIGSRIAQNIAASRPGLLRGLVIAPPLPGIGARILDADAQREFWYQAFHQLDLAEQLIDGKPDAVRAYLAHYWSHWSGPSFRLEKEDLDRLAERYAAPGAFLASIAWYRAGAARRGPGARADDGAVAGARPAVPGRMVGPPRRFLRRRAPADAARRRSLHSAGGTRRLRRSDPGRGTLTGARAADGSSGRGTLTGAVRPAALPARRQPRPMKGIVVAVIVRNCTLASSGREAM
jgi:pimeloyl-ACP methyl ester carboxylesterase